MLGSIRRAFESNFKGNRALSGPGRMGLRRGAFIIACPQQLGEDVGLERGRGAGAVAGHEDEDEAAAWRGERHGPVLATHPSRGFSGPASLASPRQPGASPRRRPRSRVLQMSSSRCIQAAPAPSRV